MKRTLYILLFLATSILSSLQAQHQITLNAKLDIRNTEINNLGEYRFVNTSNDTLNEIYFNDWANSFSSKTTPLAIRFGENFDSRFHFEKDENRGRTTVKEITDSAGESLNWERGEAADILIVTLNKPLLPGQSATVRIDHTVKLPNDKFTRYGYTREGNFNLRYWYISPAVYDGSWQAYSNKNTEDLYLTPSSFDITLVVPANYKLTSDLDLVRESLVGVEKKFILSGTSRMRAELFLERRLSYETIVTDQFEVSTNIQDKKVNAPVRALLIDRITRFLEDRLGPYPYERMVVSDCDYRNNPVYGLNQLPDFISPFPDGFEYDMEQLKTITGNFLENSMALNPRKDHWLYGAIQIYLMMEYVDTYYPNMKIIGNLSEFWIINWSHISKLEFNDQYPILYLNVARINLNQALTTNKDLLTKFNKNIANDYYAGSGFKYLSDYVGKDVLGQTIRQFYDTYKQRPTHSLQFRSLLRSKTDLPVDWFFEDYTDTRTTIDFKIKKVKDLGDSLEVVIKNRRPTSMPVSLYGLKKDSVVFKTWTKPISGSDTVVIPARNVSKLALNYRQEIPEFNQRNNYKNLDGLLNRPLQFRLFQDAEDPYYNQVFFMPVFQYNFYDGFTTGLKLYNKTLLPKRFHYRLEPQYGLKSNTLVGKGSVIYTQQLYDQKLYAARYGLSGSYFSYDAGLFYRRLTPFVTFAIRNQDDLRANEKQFIQFRNINVQRDDNPNDPDQEPNYSVFDFKYVYSDPNLINWFTAEFDFQLSSKFSKISTTMEYRKLFLNNRQINLRFFAGAFVFNATAEDDDFFSFALDRPTDYLFDYDYYGRSEESGVFSQQIIIAEGGFKSQLEPAFANSWITTVNASTNIWRWIYAYGDAGLVHNTGRGTKAVYDAGVRVSLVADYFELFFPLYSNLGWEPGLGNYDQRIRFIVTLSPKTLLGLFTREWY